VHRSFRDAGDVARRSASQRRAALGNTTRRNALADARDHLGNRQPRERRRRSSSSKRQPDAGPRGNRGATVMTRVIKIGGRPQNDPRLAEAIASGWNGGERAMVLVHGGGDEVT